MTLEKFRKIENVFGKKWITAILLEHLLKNNMVMSPISYDIIRVTHGGCIMIICSQYPLYWEFNNPAIIWGQVDKVLSIEYRKYKIDRILK